MNTDPRARDGRLQEAEAGRGGPILRPGRNCWRIATARRASLLVDADTYFLRLEQAMRSARRSILILGWDFDASIRLRPNGEDPSPPLGDLLRGLVEQHPELRVRVLVWSLSTLHAPGASLPLLLGAPWQEHPRIDLRMDRRHPLYAAHHQKIVCIDDAVAFVGGMDLTVARWDTSRHKAEDQRRVDPDGSTYGPVHDLQMVVDGEAAKMVAEVARQRWRDATGEDIPAAPAAEAAWPGDLEPDFTDTDVAVARTEPGYGGRQPVHETAALTTDALKAARRFIYIEAQYLTARRVRSTLLDILSKKDGPEVVVMMTRSPNGLLEWYFMSANRDRLVRRLKRDDPHDRLKVYYPVVPASEGDREILVHAKLMMIDDRLVRVGSSNLNNRSTGLDTECDLAVEAGGEETRQRILRLLERLLAEHLDVEPREVKETLAETGSLVAAIDRLNRNARGLRVMPAMSQTGFTWMIPGTRLFDPEGPFRLLELFRRRRRSPQAPADSSALPADDAGAPSPRPKKSSDSANSEPPMASGTRK